MAKKSAPKEKKERQPKKERKTKQKKDKNAPKRAISAFFFYQKERRESLKKEQPDLDNKQIISKMSEEWNLMNDSQKVPYAKKAEGDKVRYEKEKKDFDKTKGAVPKTSTAKKPATKKGKKEESEEEEEEEAGNE